MQKSQLQCNGGKIILTRVYITPQSPGGEKNVFIPPNDTRILGFAPLSLSVRNESNMCVAHETLHDWTENDHKPASKFYV